MCDGIIIPGGDKWTYLDELALQYAIDTQTPILGICLGMQIMGMEGNHEHIIRLKSDVHKSKESYVHKVTIQENSHLYDILEKHEITVNSRHFYTIQPPVNWDIVAKANDGTIEAIELKNHPFCIGLQWHPEDLLEDENSKKIFTKFISACKK